MITQPPSPLQIRQAQLQAILDRNIGFDQPALWMDYADGAGFKPVAAVRVLHCPDCSSGPSGRVWGQYVHYSTLIHLLECRECGLVWSDAHIDAEVIGSHFELTYKNDGYFRVQRRDIFRHLAEAIDRLAPPGARILDIGGARGDLMRVVLTRRPDLHATVHDLSPTSTAWASAHYGFQTLTGGARALASHTEQYDVVVLSDVLYYEPELRLMWSAISRLVRPGGSIVIRVPNHAWLMRLGQAWFRLTHAAERRALQDRIPFYNPEHIFVFRRRYLNDRLKSIGFRAVGFGCSPLLRGTSGIGRMLLYPITRLAKQHLRWPLVLTPSMVVIGTGFGGSPVNPPAD